MKYMNPTLVSSLNHVNLYLQNKPFQTPLCIYDDRFAIGKEKLNIGSITGLQKELHSIRIWKTKSLFDWWVNEQTGSTFIGALDYVINDDHIKCEYLSIKDVRELGYSMYDSTISLTDEEIDELSKSFINHLKIVAEKENKDKVIIDVHRNLRIFEKHYKNEGFVVTERKSRDNPYYLEVEAELLVYKDYCVK